MTAGSTATAGPASSPAVQPASALTAASTATPNRIVKRVNMSASLPACGRIPDIERLPLLAKRGGLFAQPRLHGFVRRDPVRLGVVAHVLRDLHRAEMGTTHRAKVRALRGRRRERLVMELARGLRIERQVELIVPAELEPRTRQRVVARLGARVPL